MKTYTKPMMVIEEYEATKHISTCETEKFIPPIDVSCAIKSGEQHGVFDVDFDGNIPEGYSKCVTDDSAISLVVLGKSGTNDTTYTTYACWYGSKSGNPSSGSYNSETGIGDGRALMDALNAAGVSGGNGNNVLHAGIASTKLISTLNMS